MDCFVLRSCPIWGQCLNEFVANCTHIKFIDKYTAEKLVQNTNGFKRTFFKRFNDELCTVSLTKSKNEPLIFCISYPPMCRYPS